MPSKVNSISNDSMHPTLVDQRFCVEMTSTSRVPLGLIVYDLSCVSGSEVLLLHGLPGAT
jgi:hypothetical protein